MRCFLGIPIPKELRKKIYETGKEIQMNGIRPVKSENLHWTVKFFGELNDEEIERVKEEMDLLDSPEGIEIEIQGFGTFPSSRVRVIWIGVGKGREKFTDFINKINKRFRGMGKDMEVIPHLTIGRVRFLKDRQKLMEKLGKMKDKEMGKMKVKELVLYESRLTPKGPVYKEVKKVMW